MSLSDLKIIDELFCIMKPANETWLEFEHSFNITCTAMERLRQAWKSGEMPEITLSLADYFSNEG